MVNLLWENVFKRTDKHASVQRKLKDNILFRDLNGRELKLLENIVHIRRYRPGEVIFNFGEVGVGMYIISKGSVDIFIEEILPDSEIPRQTFVTRLQEADFFGELALVDEGGKRSASASAHEDTTLIGFFKPDLLEVVERNPRAGVKILMRLGEVLGLRLKETTSKITELKKELRELQKDLISGKSSEKDLYSKGNLS